MYPPDCLFECGAKLWNHVGHTADLVKRNARFSRNPFHKSVLISVCNYDCIIRFFQAGSDEFIGKLASSG